MIRILLAVSLCACMASQSLAADFATEVLDATFKFFHKDSTSTCFLVRRPEPDTAVYLVTTAHTLERTHGETAVLVLREAKPDGSYGRHDFSIAIRKAEKPLWTRHDNMDVAVLKIAQPLPVPVAALPVSALADTAGLKASGAQLCRSLFVLTYPQRFEANGAGLPVARHGIFASPPQLPIAKHPTFLADYTTFAGDSGGPVFIETADHRPLIVGMAIAQTHHVDRMKSEYEERVVRYPLGIGTVLHAQFIREAIEMNAQQSEQATN